MISKNKIKFISSLQQKKFREETGFFLLEGEKLVYELLRSNWKIEGIYGTCEWTDHFSDSSRLEKFEEISLAELSRISSLKTPNKVLAVVAIPNQAKVDTSAEGNLILAVEEVRDPGNLGTIIRLADWFGIRKILCSTETVELYNPKTVQASMGSIFRVQVDYGKLPDLLEARKRLGYRINAAILGGENLYRLDPPQNEIIVLGNESTGISSEVLEICDRKITIPSEPKDARAESLNVSIAAAVLSSEFRRAGNAAYSK